MLPEDELDKLRAQYEVQFAATYSRILSLLNGKTYPDAIAVLKHCIELVERDAGKQIFTSSRPREHKLGHVDMTPIMNLFQNMSKLNLNNLDIKVGDKFTDAEFGEIIIEVKKVGKTKVKVLSDRTLGPFIQNTNSDGIYESEIDIRDLFNDSKYIPIDKRVD